MGSANPAELGVRANRSIAQSAGKPVECVTRTTTVADAATAALVGGAVYLAYATQDCWVNIDAVAAVGSIMFIPGAAKSLIPVVFGPPGSAPVVHAIRSSVDGVLYLTRMDDVG